MRTLVIDTATAACSVALIEDERVIARAHEVVGRGHAERVVAMIADLPGGGRADALLVDCGPGSFTGVRVGLAAAIGLGIGWGVPVTGYSSLPLIAARAFADDPALAALGVVIEGGHGEVFMQPFAARPFASLAPLVSLRPEAASAALGDRTGVGSGMRLLTEVDPTRAASDRLPDAADAVLLPPAQRALPPRPIYGRPPDAKPQVPAT